MLPLSVNNLLGVLTANVNGIVLHYTGVVSSVWLTACKIIVYSMQV